MIGLEAIKDVITSGFDLNTKFSEYGGGSVLFNAAVNYNRMQNDYTLTIMKLLLENGADRESALHDLDTIRYGGPEPPLESIIPQIKEIFKQYD